MKTPEMQINIAEYSASLPLEKPAEDNFIWKISKRQNNKWTESIKNSVDEKGNRNEFTLENFLVFFLSSGKANWDENSKKPLIKNYRFRGMTE